MDIPISTSWNLIWLASKKFSATATAYMAYIRAEKDSLIKGKFNWH
jgi:hypothetical protein